MRPATKLRRAPHDSALQERCSVNGSDETLSIAAAAERLGVSRWTIWRMIADGELDAESIIRGNRVTTRVQLPEHAPEDPAGAPPRSRTARLQERVDRLTHSVECLSEMLLNAERERAELRAQLERHYAHTLHGAAPAPAQLSAPVSPPTPEPEPEPEPEPPPAPKPGPAAVPSPKPEPLAHQRERGTGFLSGTPARQTPVYDPIPPGITARPNPMTHPAALFGPTRGPAGEELLQPVRHLFKRDLPRRPWWQKLPVVGS